MLFVDERLLEHPKVVAAGKLLGAHGAARVIVVYLAGLRHAAHYLTDGFLSDDFVTQINVVENAQEVVQMMSSTSVTKRPLWRRVDGGYQIHDYRDWNSKAFQLKRKREATRKRVARHRARKKEAQAVTPVTRATNTTTNTTIEIGSYARSPEVLPTEGSRAQSAATRARRGLATLVQSPLALRNVAYPNDVVHVPSFIHARFLDRLVNAGTERAEAERRLFSWYREVCDQWRGRAIGDTEPRFWEGRFEEWQGRTASGATAQSVGDQNAAVLRRVLLRDEEPES